MSSHHICRHHQLPKPQDAQTYTYHPDFRAQREEPAFRCAVVAVVFVLLDHVEDVDVLLFLVVLPLLALVRGSDAASGDGFGEVAYS